jgi:hypothetical protein
MLDEIEHEWKYYFDDEGIETVWKQDEATVLEELRITYGISHPPDGYARKYWELTVASQWRRGEDWKFLWQRTGRPIAQNPLPLDRMLICCKIHLNDCFEKSYPFCDLKSRLELYCDNCHNPIIGCDSRTYCARCYRQTLNGWRPT